MNHVREIIPQIPENVKFELRVYRNPVTLNNRFYVGNLLTAERTYDTIRRKI